MQRRGGLLWEGPGCRRPRRSGRGARCTRRVSASSSRAPRRWAWPGAFTAQADDPSRCSTTPAASRSSRSASSRPASPGSTAPRPSSRAPTRSPATGYAAEQKKLSEFPPHLYYVQPINRHLEVRPRRQRPVRPDHRVGGPRTVRRPLPQHQGGAARRSTSTPRSAGRSRPTSASASAPSPASPTSSSTATCRRSTPSPSGSSTSAQARSSRATSARATA